jgi:hypothetical protein
MQLPVPWNGNDELEEIKQCVLLLPDTTHFVQTDFKTYTNMMQTTQ